MESLLSNTMKVGILRCDSWKPVAGIWNKYGDVEDMITRFLCIGNKKIQTVIFDCTSGECPTDDSLNDYNGFIISGSRFGANDDIPWIKQLQNRIRRMDELKIKLFGICFGHQVISQALGGKVERIGWNLGHNKIQLDKSFVAAHQTRFPRQDFISCLAVHQDQVVKVPPGMNVWCSNDACKIQGLLKDSHILTIQSHPEMHHEILRELLLTKQTISKDVLNKALQTIDLPTDSRSFSDWVYDFFKTKEYSQESVSMASQS